jgi:predicted alpha/beta-hydrolase family hydrolase
VKAVFVCAHGAGGHKDDRGMLGLAATLEPRGFEVVRFNFPYREKRSPRPDPMPTLKSCISEVAARSRRTGASLYIGGRSMGGRAASMLAADGFACDGVLLLAYPLHPAGKPDQLRSAHLPGIRVPVLCINGTRDSLCTRKLMDDAVGGLPGWTMHWLEGADHSFRVLKSFGRDEAEVYEEVGAICERWHNRLQEEHPR